MTAGGEVFWLGVCVLWWSAAPNLYLSVTSSNVATESH